MKIIIRGIVTRTNSKKESEFIKAFKEELLSGMYEDLNFEVLDTRKRFSINDEQIFGKYFNTSTIHYV